MKHIKRIRQMAPLFTSTVQQLSWVYRVVYGTKKIKNKLVGHSVERIGYIRRDQTEPFNYYYTKAAGKTFPVLRG